MYPEIQLLPSINSMLKVTEDHDTASVDDASPEIHRSITLLVPSMAWVLGM